MDLEDDTGQLPVRAMQGRGQSERERGATLQRLIVGKHGQHITTRAVLCSTWRTAALHRGCPVCRLCVALRISCHAKSNDWVTALGLAFLVDFVTQGLTTNPGFREE